MHDGLQLKPDPDDGPSQSQPASVRPRAQSRSTKTISRYLRVSIIRQRTRVYPANLMSELAR